MKKITYSYLLGLILLSPVIFSDNSSNNKKELISFFDYFEGKDLLDTNTKQDLKQYTLEKCSALSFVWIGGDGIIT